MYCHDQGFTCRSRIKVSQLGNLLQFSSKGYCKGFKKIFGGALKTIPGKYLTEEFNVAQGTLSAVKTIGVGAI